MALLHSGGDDPRQARPVDEPAPAFDRPLVARPPGRGCAGVAAALVVAAGAGVFLWLSAHRAAANTAAEPLPRAPRTSSATPEPIPLASAQTPTSGPLFPVPAPQFTTDNRVPEPMTAAPMTPYSAALPSGPSELDRRRAPAVVVDLGGQIAPIVLARSDTPRPMPAGGGARPEGDAAPDHLSDDERFADRIGGSGPERARATALRNLDALVPQGALISAVLETAINSDLPGYARAVVSRDVKSFDGSTVLIPRGSRLIGQYRSGVALGASRVFVIWTRVLRPDGVSVEIASPGTDALGRAGLGGDVDRHFFRRFGSAILLSVVSAGAAALANSGGGQIFIGSSVDAASVAAAALAKDGGAAPTIRTPQGAAVRVFVARDLDFSGVRP